MNIILADRQDITRAGLMYIIGRVGDARCAYAESKATLIEALSKEPHSVVIMDYTLFDMDGFANLLVLCQRFPQVHWLLFSDDLSIDFIRQAIANTRNISILTKDSSAREIEEGIRFAMRGQRFICQQVTEMLLTPAVETEEKANLTKTEVEVLKDIALGLTTKEIAEKRFSSFHTVNTHRKNIFRKIRVNNAHEATKYALRAGLIDSAEYYI